MRSTERNPHPAFVLTLVFVLTAGLLLVFIEEWLPFQDSAVEWARSEDWTSWLAHGVVVVALMMLWWGFGGEVWGGVIFANALNLGHEAGQKLYGGMSWANLDTAMDLFLPLALSMTVAWAYGRTRADPWLGEVPGR